MMEEDINQLKKQVKDRDEVIKHSKNTEQEVEAKMAQFEDLKKRHEKLKYIGKLF